MKSTTSEHNVGEEIIYSPNQDNPKIRLPDHNTCNQSPYFDVILKLEESEELVGPVVGHGFGEKYSFDFYAPQTHTLYKICHGNDMDTYDDYKNYHRDLLLVLDLNDSECGIEASEEDGVPFVYIPLDSLSLDSQRTWLYHGGKLFTFSHEPWYGGEVWSVLAEVEISKVINSDLGDKITKSEH